MPYTEDHC